MNNSDRSGRSLDYLDLRQTNYLYLPEAKPPSVADCARRLQVYVSPHAPVDVPYDNNPSRYVEYVRKRVVESRWSTHIYSETGRHYRSSRHWVDYDQARPLDPVMQYWYDSNREEVADIRQGRNIEEDFFKVRYLPTFSTMVRTVAQAPRIMADMRADHYRDQVARGIPQNREMLDSAVRRGEYTSANIAEATRIVEEFDYRMSMPDFWRLETDQQDEIIGHIGRQCLYLWDAAARYGTVALLARERVFPHPINQLDEVLSSADGRERAPEVFEAFMANPAVFANMLKQTRDGEQQEVQGADFRKLVRGMEVGEVLHLSEGSTPIARRQIRQVFGEFSMIAAHQIRSMHEYPGKVKFANWHTEETDIAEQLIGNHYGNITNLRVQRGAVDDASAKRLVYQWRPQFVPLETIRRYIASADFKVGGRTVPAAIEFAVFMRHSSHGPQLNKAVMAPRGTDQYERLMYEASSKARNRYYWNVLHARRTSHGPKR